MWKIFLLLSKFYFASVTMTLKFSIIVVQWTQSLFSISRTLSTGTSAGFLLGMVNAPLPPEAKKILKI